MISLICVGNMLVACGGDDNGDTPPPPATKIVVSPTAELLGNVSSTTTVSVSIQSDEMWTISGVPEWLSLNRSGVGPSSVLITATQENFSDTEREAELVFSTSDGSSTATCKVSQKGVLAKNCRVNLGETTVMWDGFVTDLGFDANCKGYREAFFTARAVDDMTERDIYNMLMEKTEYSKKADYTFSPIVTEEGLEIVYCVAAYGSEANTDGSHKYGPMTMKHIKLPMKTPESTMSLNLSYTSSTWSVNALREGRYGQKCDEYYYAAWEGEAASEFHSLTIMNSALIAHAIKKEIAKDGYTSNYKYGPQKMSWSRNSNTFFCATWGKNKDTGEFSTLLGYVYRNLSSNSYNGTIMKSDLKDKTIDLREKYPLMNDLLKQVSVTVMTDKNAIK